MRKLLSRGKQQLMMLLLILAGASVLSCASGLPKPPEGEMGLHDAAAGLVFRSDLRTGSTLPTLDIRNTDNWIMFPPKTWENVSNYIDELIRRLERKGFTGDDELFVVVGNESVKIKLSDIKKFRDHLRRVKRKITPPFA